MIKMLWCNDFFSDGLKKKTRESDLVTVKHPELFLFVVLNMCRKRRLRQQPFVIRVAGISDAP